MNSLISCGSSRVSSVRDRASSTVASSTSASNGFCTKWKAPALIARHGAVGTSPYAVIIMTVEFFVAATICLRKFNPAHTGELIVKENARRLVGADFDVRYSSAEP